MTMRNKTVLGAALAGALLSFGMAAQAYTAIVVAPPAPRHEVVPTARAGMVWAPGHYEWRGGEYAWVGGHWLRDRPGYEYREPRWVQRGNGEWILVGNNWERRGPYGDRDGDGIANRYDTNNRRFGPRGDMDRDGIQNRYDKDRDGDGIRNARDRHPDNPRRG
jgi:hypothetical protein